MKKNSLAPSDIIIFGGCGDLSRKKIVPSLYYRHKDKQLPRKGRIILIGRSNLSNKECLADIKRVAKEVISKEYFDNSVWKSFEKRLSYNKLDVSNLSDFISLKELVEKDACRGRVFYLATPSDIFGEICLNLKESGMITRGSKVVLEKPLGFDLSSFKKINSQVQECFPERQIYRIDHYLGKETVQNLMIIRFANNLFERVWNSDSIEQVQITVSEDIGIEGREKYYEKSGAIKDMVQNHLLQLLCLVAMEPPNKIDPDIIREEKLKVLKSLQPINGSSVKSCTVRGQYDEGKIDGKVAKSYSSEVGKKSDVETFIALKAFVDNWRWSGVPFYLRTGKRMAKRYSEVVLQFKHVPHELFPDQKKDPESNKLIIRLQPDESIKLAMVTKLPGPGGYRLNPVELNLSLADTYKERVADAYERLLMDVIRGNPTLFMSADEVEAAWKWIDDIIKSWKKYNQKVLLYKAGSNGPKKAESLIKKDGHKWYHDE